MNLLDIKFRQAYKDSDGKSHWHYWGYLMEHNNLFFRGPISTHTSKGKLRESYQFTTLFDINGKEIYAGSKIKNKHGEIGIVEWDNELGVWWWEHGENWGKIEIYFDKIEVIGNTSGVIN